MFPGKNGIVLDHICIQPVAELVTLPQMPDRKSSS